ncbi:hypothetical protein ACFW2E_08050, partial [Streptomyces sp. NPDC058964]
MNADTSRQNPAEWDESAQLISRTARDLPTGRHQFHRERLMARIHDMQQAERTAAAPAKARRFRLPRPAIMLPAMAVAAATVVVASQMSGGGGVEDGGVAHGPAQTTQVGAPTPQGVPPQLDPISQAAV